MSLPVAILAGGLGTRMRSITETIPKSLIDIGGEPFAAHQIELLRRNGMTDIVFLVSHLGEMVSDALGDGSRWGVRLRYVFDGPQRLGTGGAIRRALTFLDDPFLVLYGDSYLDCDYAGIARAFSASGRRALMTVCHNDNQWDRSNVLFEADRIVAYDKQHQTAAMHHIDYGLGVFHKSAFDGYGDDDAFDLAAIYQTLIAAGDLAGYDVKRRFYEIGSPAGLAETRLYLAGKGVVGR